MERLMKKLGWSSVAFLLCIFLVGCGQEEKVESDVRPVKAAMVGTEQGFSGHAFPGRAKAAKEADLAFGVSGTLNQRPVKVGEKVKNGQLIASLDPRDFEAQLSLDAANKERDEKNFARGSQLVENGHISRVEYDRLKAQYAVSSAKLELSQKALSDSVLRAPFDGQIADLYVENFQTVTSQQRIARLLDISQIEMVIQIPENVISLIPYAKDIVIQFDAFPNRQFPAQIKEVSNEASPTTRTYPVTLVMQQQADVEILPGMAGSAMGQAVLPNQLSASQLTVPASAIFSEKESNKSYVWVIDLKTYQAHRRNVVIGKPTLMGILVKSGLRRGEWVVTAGVYSLREGQQVTILKN